MNTNQIAHSLEPVVEQFQTASEAVVIAHLPAVTREEVKIESAGRDLTIKIVGPSDSKQMARMGYYSHEVVKLYGFSKTIFFNFDIDFSKIKATFKHGVLEVRVPKI